MNARGDRGRNRVQRLPSFATESDLDHARFIFDEQTDGLAADSPQLGELRNAVVPFKGGSLRRHVVIAHARSSYELPMMQAACSVP